MSQSTVLKSFAELGEFFDLDALRPEVTEFDVGATAVETNEPFVAADLADLLAQLEAASATLATVVRQDQETRALALRDLEQYDALVAAQIEAETAHARARQVREQAGAFVQSAFADEARAAATRVANLAAQAEDAAARQVDERRREVDGFASRLDIDRLLAERKREEEAQRTRAAEAERAQRLSEGIARARCAIDSGSLEEAKALVGPLAKANPGSADLASLRDIIARRELSVKVDAAEGALRAARREYRRDPNAAVARLVDLDTERLPDPLARQVFGEWARACSRLCRDRSLVDPLRYAPDPARGAILARERDDAPYTVLSALGLDDRWQPGAAAPERFVQRARPLR